MKEYTSKTAITELNSTVSLQSFKECLSLSLCKCLVVFSVSLQATPAHGGLAVQPASDPRYKNKNCVNCSIS